MDKPSVGSLVKVIVSYSEHFAKYPVFIPDGIFEGRVEASEKFDDPNSFRVCTNGNYHPVSVIIMDKTLKSISGIEFKPIEKLPSNKRIFKVRSGEKEYLVTLIGNRYECSCTGYQFRKTCKHINQVKERIDG